MVNENNEKAGVDSEKFVVIPGGLNEGEFEAIMHLAGAWEAFMKLDTDIQSRSSFLHSLHQCQRIVGMRVLGRMFPAFWKGV